MPPFSRPMIPPTMTPTTAATIATASPMANALDDEEEADPADDGAGQGAGDAVEHAALPDVVTARPRHRRDEAGIRDRQERHRDGREDDRQQGVRPWHVGEDRQAVEHAQRDEVDRHERVRERVEPGPSLDQAGRVPEEQRRRRGTGCHDSLLCPNDPPARRESSAVDQQITLHLAFLDVEVDDRRLEHAVLVRAAGVHRQGAIRASPRPCPRGCGRGARGPGHTPGSTHGRPCEPTGTRAWPPDT